MATERSGDDLVRVVLVVLAIVVLAPLLLMGVAMPMMGLWWGGGMMGGGGGLGWWGIGASLLWLAVLVAIGYGAYRLLAGGGRGARRADPAMEELRLAYARGDLTHDEFEERRQRLHPDE